MTVGQLARRVGRSVDTIKRWEDQKLFTCPRDYRGRRIYDQSHVDLCLRLAELAIVAQRRSEPLSLIAAAEPRQLTLLDANVEHDTTHRLAS
jgi:hypothetical protein